MPAEPDSPIDYRGPGPFDLPLAQSATVRATGRALEVTIYCILPGRGPFPEAVRFQIVAKPALALAEELQRVATEIELKYS
jgi:hypothetical protein